MTDGQGRFFGKYRGRVSDNDDPLKVGRVRVKVSDVFGDHDSGWALPSFPLAASGLGLFMVPPVDAWVWVEFEYGNPEKPIWTGCFFPDDPAAVASSVAQLLPLVGVDKDKIALKTAEWLVTIESSKVVIASLQGPVPRTRLEVTANDIKLTNEQAPNVPSPPSATIEMSGPSVKINGSALEVT
jgi:hypothetical protein